MYQRPNNHMMSVINSVSQLRFSYSCHEHVHMTEVVYAYDQLQISSQRATEEHTLQMKNQHV